MNIAEAARDRELRAKVETLERQVADLTRRFDDLSALQRNSIVAETEKTLRLQKRG